MRAIFWKFPRRAKKFTRTVRAIFKPPPKNCGTTGVSLGLPIARNRCAIERMEYKRGCPDDFFPANGPGSKSRPM
jgi:hypothetical protein